MYTTVGLTLTIVDDFRRFLSQFSTATNSNEIRLLSTIFCSWGAYTEKIIEQNCII